MHAARDALYRGFIVVPRFAQALPRNDALIDLATMSFVSRREPGGSGKTSLIDCLGLCDFRDGPMCTKRLQVDEALVTVSVLDSVCLDEGAAFPMELMCQAVLYCSTFCEPGALRHIVQAHADILECVSLSWVPFIIVRTKADLELPFVEREVVLDWARKEGAGFICT